MCIHRQVTYITAQLSAVLLFKEGKLYIYIQHIIKQNESNTEATQLEIMLRTCLDLFLNALSLFTYMTTIIHLYSFSIQVHQPSRASVLRSSPVVYKKRFPIVPPIQPGFAASSPSSLTVEQYRMRYLDCPNHCAKLRQDHIA